MSQFYARYVPPSTKPDDSVNGASKNEKRKRETELQPATASKRAKTHGSSNEGKSEKRPEQSSVSKPCEQQGRSVKALKQPAAVEKAAQKQKEKHSPEVSQPDTDGVEGGNIVFKRTQTAEAPERVEVKKKKKKRKPEHSEPADGLAGDDEDYARKHGGVLSKFNKALAERPTRPDTEEEAATKAPEELHGLEPIPQPVVVDRPVERPSYSVLPRWQAEAMRVVHRETRAFSDLPITPSTVKNLEKNGLEHTFPIQTTVLPLLLDGEARHDGDVCVSAATGSGKTLAYVLPMVEDIKEYPDCKLRGIIVVPTRELVQQVRQLCEICAAGSQLKIVVASGSKTMKDEQASLVSEVERYDPQQWEAQQKASVDWANFSMAKFMQEAREAQRPSSFHFVKQYRSKADILITTPGRLVDHLRTTPGFNLDHVRWLVVDEADRLLNESYQEWIDVVTPALQSKAATAERDSILRQMRMDPPPREVKKVLLSATMTRDISKLNSLGLVNPKLIVLGHPHAIQQATADDHMLTNGETDSFHLPPTLTELVVPIKDGYDKPLYLLEILQTRILTTMNSEPDPVASSESDSSSSFSSDGMDSDSISNSSSSDSTSESENESKSDSGSDSSSSSDASPVRASKSLKRSAANDTASSIDPSSSNRVLIFTRSTASTTRLSRLLSLLSPRLSPLISVLTKSTSSSASSRRALSSFRSGRTPILIATDRASRGLDIPDLQHVINYDVPGSVLTYVHRVGRTARAGREGTAWTCVEHREGRWFWGEIGGKGKGVAGAGAAGLGIVRAEGRRVQKVELEVDVEGSKEKYERALAKLGEEVKGR